MARTVGKGINTPESRTTQKPETASPARGRLVPVIHAVTFVLGEPVAEWTPGLNPGVTEMSAPESRNGRETVGRNQSV